MAKDALIPLVNVSSDVYDRPYNIVSQQIDKMSDRADEALNTAFSSIAQLSTVQLPQEATPPDLKPDPIRPGDVANVPLPSAQKFGAVPDFSAPAFEDFQDLLTGLDPGQAPSWDPSIVQLNIPSAPAPIDTSGAPVRPTIVDPVLPDAPDTTMPVTEPMLAIDIPDRPSILLPTFDATVPTFDDAVPTLGLDWAEPTYRPTVLNEVADTVRAMLTGEFGMPAVVQAALFSAAREREDVTAHKAVQEAFDDFAGRGFGMPPGMLAAAVKEAREQNQLQVNALSREVLSKAADWAIENLRQAVQQGIALEGTLINQFNNLAQRSFEMARQRVQVEFDRHNLRVTSYNARLQTIDALVRVFQARVQAELSKLEQFKAEIEAEQLKGTVNEQNVRIYTAKLQALATVVEVFKARIDATKTAADLERGKIDMYRADVQAYAERLAADKTRFDAYESQVRGEAAKAGLLESEARAFAATVQGYESGNNVKVQVVQTRLRAIEAGTSKYVALLQAEREKVQAALEQVQAQVSSFTADTSRYAAQVSAGTQQNEILVRSAEANARNNMAYFEVLSRQFDSRMQRMIEQARLVISSIQAAGGMASQLAAGAMSATHVQAGINGNGSASISASNSYSVSTSLDATSDNQ
ncbi:hypothetical protein [Dyella japonica]|uniref:hypothetical protein n=1 Tax=Dyella japonica TaxID=231455 RepID=UPI00069BFD12|nr:hypothetical protein [Dyella japonica]